VTPLDVRVEASENSKNAAHPAHSAVRMVNEVLTLATRSGEGIVNQRTHLQMLMSSVQ
jgi:hypothetical protein